MNKDIVTLFVTRIIRLFCYGFLSVILALYLVQAGLEEQQVGLLFTLTLAGDAGISLWLTTSADRFGRKRTLILGALLMLGAGLVFIITRNIYLLMAAAIIGVIFQLMLSNFGDTFSHGLVALHLARHGREAPEPAPYCSMARIAAALS